MYYTKISEFKNSIFYVLENKAFFEAYRYSLETLRHKQIF